MEKFLTRRWYLLLLTFAACSRIGSPSETDSDTQGRDSQSEETDTGSSDTNTDADSDTHSGADGDSDTDSDSDIDADGDADTDADTNADSDTHTDTDNDTSMDSDSHPDTAIEQGTDSFGDSESDTETEYASCKGALPLQCGDELEGTTEGGRPNEWSAYNCSAQIYSGPESLYRFVSQSNVTVDAHISSTTKGLFLFLVPYCERIDFFAHATECSYIPTGELDEGQFSFSAEAGVPYFFVVDGHDDAKGPFTLSLSCTVSN